MILMTLMILTAFICALFLLFTISGIIRKSHNKKPERTVRKESLISKTTLYKDNDKIIPATSFFGAIKMNKTLKSYYKLPHEICYWEVYLKGDFIEIENRVALILDYEDGNFIMQRKNDIENIKVFSVEQALMLLTNEKIEQQIHAKEEFKRCTDLSNLAMECIIPVRQKVISYEDENIVPSYIEEILTGIQLRFSFEMNKYRNYETNSYSYLRVEVIESLLELQQEAKAMDHCVRKYFLDITNGKYIVFRVLNTITKERLTMGCFIGTKFNLRFDQLKGFDNKAASLEIRPLIREYCKSNNITIPNVTPDL